MTTKNELRGYFILEVPNWKTLGTLHPHDIYERFLFVQFTILATQQLIPIMLVLHDCVTYNRLFTVLSFPVHSVTFAAFVWLVT